MKSASQHPRKHHAWRPAPCSGEAGVEQSLAAHDYSVATREKTELEAMLGQLEADNTELEDRIAESTAVMNRNMEARVFSCDERNVPRAENADSVKL